MQKPLFSRRHYNFVAQIIRNNESDSKMIYALLDAFKKDNPNFDNSRFLKECAK